MAPIKTVCPRDERAAEGMDSWETYGDPDPTYTEQCYFCELVTGDDGYTEVMLRNAGADRGVSMRFRGDQLPCFTVWKNTVAEADGFCWPVSIDI